MKIAIVTGTTRLGRNNTAARWVLELAATRCDADVELVDIAMLDQVIAWSSALRGLRSHSTVKAA